MKTHPLVVPVDSDLTKILQTFLALSDPLFHSFSSLGEGEKWPHPRKPPSCAPTMGIFSLFFL